MNLEEKKKFLINCSYFFVWSLILFLLFKIMAVYLLPFLIGVIIAYLVQKPARFLSRKLSIKKESVCAAFSVSFYLMVTLLLVLLGWVLYKQSNKVIKFFSHSGIITGLIDKTVEILSTCFKGFDSNFGDMVKRFTQQTEDVIIAKASTGLSNILAGVVKKIPSLIFTFIVTIVSTCYISIDYDRLKIFLAGLVNHNFFKKVTDIKDVFFNCFYKMILGYILLCVITYFELLIGLMLLKVNNFLLISFIIAVIDLLPVFGTGIVLVPWAIISFFQNDYKAGAGLILLYITLVIVRNFLEPKIIGKQIGINPLFTLVFIFLGLRIGGIFGMIAVPVVFTVVFSYYRQQLYKN